MLPKRKQFRFWGAPEGPLSALASPREGNCRVFTAFFLSVPAKGASSPRSVTVATDRVPIRN